MVTSADGAKVKDTDGRWVPRVVWVPADLDAALQAACGEGETPGAALVRLARRGMRLEQQGETN